MSVHMCMHMSIHRCICMSVHLAIHMSTHMSANMSTRRSNPNIPADELYPCGLNQAAYARGSFQTMLAAERLRPPPSEEADGADVVRGVWTCCQSFNKRAAGCKEARHTLLWTQVCPHF